MQVVQSVTIKLNGEILWLFQSEKNGVLYLLVLFFPEPATNKGANWIYATQLDQYTTLNSDNLICQEVWLNSYAGINATNEIISRIDEMSEEILNATPRYRAIAAEARFLQALWYFNMVRIFGGVPILTTPSRSSSNYEVDRNSIKEVYAHIFTLLEYAKQFLPETVSQYSDHIKIPQSLQKTSFGSNCTITRCSI